MPLYRRINWNPQSTREVAGQHSADFLQNKPGFALDVEEKSGSSSVWNKSSYAIPYVDLQSKRDAPFGFGAGKDDFKKLLEQVRSGAKANIVTVGSSITAGAGDVPSSERYFEHYINWLTSWANISTEAVPERINFTNAGQGGATSVYGALLYSVLVPEGTDLLFWEFSVNDKSLEDDGLCCSKEDMLFIQDLFLRRVAAMKKPPVVVLVYVWSSPLVKDLLAGVNLYDSSFESTSEHALAFPFVAGYVSMVNEIKRWGDDTLKVQKARKKLFADRVHPNGKAHRIIGQLLRNLSIATLESSPSSTDLKITPKHMLTSRESIDWPCQTYGLKIGRALQSMRKTYAWTLLEPTDHGHNLPATTWNRVTGETRNVLETSKTVLTGVTSSIRKDRKYALTLPSCSDHNYIRFDLTGVQRPAAFQIFVDDADSVEVYTANTSNPTAIKMHKLEIEDAGAWTGTNCMFRTSPRSDYRVWAHINPVLEASYAFVCQPQSYGDTPALMRWFAVVEV